MTLDEYFHLIVNKPPVKETTMFEYLKNKWAELVTTRYTFINGPQPLEEEEEYEQEGWAFVMKTPSYIDEYGEFIAAKDTTLVGANDGTWLDIVDHVLDVISEHYGYNVKEQVYYSVCFPLNKEDMPGYGRSLNDEILQKLLLAYPEVYEQDTSFKWKKI